MTLAPETQRTIQEVGVLFTPDPDRKPMAIRYEGHVWAVDQDVHAAHWFTRDAWWETRNRATIGTGNVVSIEYWQFHRDVCSELGSSRNARIIYPDEVRPHGAVFDSVSVD